ncbi:hypothetical protein KSW27_02675 [Holdemanella biformis]|uniref:leucine-rich repeat domain-containing protein n=1 Tax=Holdemanella biformis TaxID=1735 RepID=UPI001C381B0D|nr:leucine-rich repeat domain-containing protein [Holdemanella biformis]MBV3416202.1 hypothetical protein [Holdemanella biformis]
MKKRLFSILLAQCMVLNFVPITAFAEDSTEETPECTCETTCTEETMNAECPVCGAKGALPEKCGKYVEPAAEDETSQPKGEKTQEKQNSDMPDTQSEAALAQMNGDGENGIAVQSAGVAIDDTNFPDVNFRSFVAEKYDIDGDDCLSDAEIAAVTELNCYNRGISDLTGIGHFTALTKLSCNENRLTSLDVSKNSALTYLSCYGNQLTVLDVSKNTSLTKLFCDSNQLTSLDVSKNNALNILWCQNNQLTSLDVSGNTALEHLDCKNNRLMTLNVSNTALGNMNCSNNQLTSLDLSKNYKSIDYSCDNNIYQIALDENRTFDLSTLPGTFDVSKTRNWNGGSVSGNILTVDDDTNIVTYTYDCGNSQNPTFTLKCTQAIRGLGMYVNGEQFTTEKLSIACGEGTATYDPDTKTLTLNNATITNGGKNDESPKYGIRVIGDTDLTIKLLGTNSITLANGGGIFADGHSDNYNIIGNGKLTINVRWDALYTLNGNISISEGAKLDIKSAEGSGITSYNKGKISIDNAKITVSSYYTAVDAKELYVKNASEVVLHSSANQFNAVYMGDENGTGKIEIINSKVEATSYYPALYTEGTLTVNGGEVKCTSTADAAIWTQGDILIKGGAKITTDGKYPMGGNGTFAVEEAEIDAKNTSENNIPAIFDECVPVIADGYQLTYAKAVDAEGTEIDLLSSGTQYFALYKNVHFITKAAYPVTFVVTPDELTNVVVKVNGQAVTNPVNLVAGTYQIEVTADNCKAYSGNITVTDDAATHTQNIAMTYLPADYTKVDAAIVKANKLNKDDYKNFSAVDTAINAVDRNKNITEQSEVDKMAKAIEDAIADLQYKDANYDKVNEAIAKANKLNKGDYKDFSGVDNAVNAVDRNKNFTEQSEVDAMAKAIEDAIADLQYKDANYDKVNEAIANANKLNKDDYKDFTGVEAAVNAVVRGKNITEQSEVDKMAKAIEDAIAALQYKDANYDEVDAAITKADALNKDDYKDFSTVDTAINAVARGKNITEQSEVDKMAKAIEDAIATLQYKDANYDKVNEAIAKTNKLNKGDYKDFSGVDNAVNAVVRDKNITEQSEVDKMAKAIEDAIADLKYKDADYTKVDAAIKKANALKKDDYKDFSGVKNAVKAVVRGKNITEQSEVDKMAKAIENAISALEKKPASAKPGTSDKNPKTGYTSNLALWIALLFISGGAAVGTMVVSRKKKYNK